MLPYMAYMDPMGNYSHSIMFPIIKGEPVVATFIGFPWDFRRHGCRVVRIDHTLQCPEICRIHWPENNGEGTHTHPKKKTAWFSGQDDAESMDLAQTDLAQIYGQFWEQSWETMFYFWIWNCREDCPLPSWKRGTRREAIHRRRDELINPQLFWV